MSAPVRFDPGFVIDLPRPPYIGGLLICAVLVFGGGSEIMAPMTDDLDGDVLPAVVRSDELGKHLNVGGVMFRHMLPSGVHCEGCHALVNVDEAYAGMDASDFVSCFDLGVLVALLDGHVETTCRGGPAAGVDIRR